jgi:RND family efflux transporter MFP subunit
MRNERHPEPAQRGEGSQHSKLLPFGDPSPSARLRMTVGVVLLLLAACSKKEAPDAAPVVSVRVAKAEIAPIAQPIELVGVITARQEAGVAAKVGGQIVQMALLKNRVVHAGEVLGRIEARDVAAQRAEAAAAVATARDAVPPAEAALETARRSAERRAELYAKGGISKKDVEASQLDVATAAGALKTANGKVAEARQHLASFDAQLAYADVRAPFDGVVTEQFLRQGDFAAAGTKILTVADTSSVIVKAPLSDEQAARVHAGDAVTIQPTDLAGVSIPARVDLVGRSADPQSRAVELWVTLPNDDGGRLRVNGTARVVVASAGVPNAVVVPTSALTLDATNANAGSVMVVDAQSAAHEVRVTTGAHTRERTQIVSGLRGGETVVVEGNYGLPDGTKVQTEETGNGEQATGGRGKG